MGQGWGLLNETAIPVHIYRHTHGLVISETEVQKHSKILLEELTNYISLSPLERGSSYSSNVISTLSTRTNVKWYLIQHRKKNRMWHFHRVGNHGNAFLYLIYFGARYRRTHASLMDLLFFPRGWFSQG